MTVPGAMRRDRHLGRLRREPFDVLVVGGGISGAAVARDAARRGLRTGLVEARDFGEGTSSRSSRLIHGGLRYLEHLELDLVFEASRERKTLLRIAPHLVRPLKFLFPLYEGGRVGRRKLDAGMWLYDALSFFQNVERHQMLEPEEVLEREPGLRADGLLGGARYFDAQVDDARLVLLTVVGAAEAGAAVANRVEAVDFLREDGAITGARVRAEEGDEWSVDARLVVNATGPWTDRTLQRADGPERPLLRPTRGSHVHLPRGRLGHDRALIFESPLDDRIMFVLPWGELTLVGTTDEDFEGEPEAVLPTADDVSYLLESVDDLFPEADADPSDVVSAWAGLRPLVAEEGAEEAGEVSRDFVVREGPPGMLTLTGGKLTSHRAMAEELVDEAAAFLEEAFGREAGEADTDGHPLPGGDFDDREELLGALGEAASGLRLPGSSLRRLLTAYGTRAEDLLGLLEDRPALREPLVEDLPYLAGEVVHAARREMAVHLEDVVFRRTRFGWETRYELETGCRRAARLMAAELGWTEEREEAELHRALEVRARNDGFRRELGG